MNKKHLIVFSFLISFTYGYSQTGWIQQESGTKEDLKSVYFTDENKGYVVGNYGTILKTYDGGGEWVLDDFIDKYHLYSIFSKNNTTYVTGETEVFMGNGIYKKAGPNNKWKLTHIENNVGKLGSIYFIDEKTGYAVGYSGVILKTSNGGKTWVIQNKPRRDSESWYKLHSIFFTNSITGYAIGGGSMGGLVLRTNDGGISWIKQNRDSIPYMESVYFCNAKIGYAVDGQYIQRNSTILKTTDGGVTWNTLSYVNPDKSFYNLYSIFFTDSLTGYAVGDLISYSQYEKAVKIDTIEPLIVKTIDGGNTWKRQYFNCNPSRSLISVFFINNKIGYVVGASGIILKTVTGGE